MTTLGVTQIQTPASMSVSSSTNVLYKAKSATLTNSSFAGTVSTATGSYSTFVSAPSYYGSVAQGMTAMPNDFIQIGNLNCRVDDAIALYASHIITTEELRLAVLTAMKNGMNAVNSERLATLVEMKIITTDEAREFIGLSKEYNNFDKEEEV